jgi:excisionase family DNA binding protein
MQTLDPTERFLTCDEVAALLNMQESGVRTWCNSGRLAAYQPGGRRLGWRIRERDLRRFLEASSNQRETEAPQ